MAVAVALAFFAFLITGSFTDEPAPTIVFITVLLGGPLAYVVWRAMRTRRARRDEDLLEAALLATSLATSAEPMSDDELRKRVALAQQLARTVHDLEQAPRRD